MCSSVLPNEETTTTNTTRDSRQAVKTLEFSYASLASAAYADGIENGVCNPLCPKRQEPSEDLRKIKTVSKP